MRKGLDQQVESNWDLKNKAGHMESIVERKNFKLNPWWKFASFLFKPFKHKQVVCTRRRMLSTILKYLFLFQRYSSFWNMQISNYLINSTEFWSAILKKTSQPICTRNAWFLAVRFYYAYSTIWFHQFSYHGNIPVSDLPNIKSFAGRLWRSILMFANGRSSARPSKHINMLARACGLLKYFLKINHQKW